MTDTEDADEATGIVALTRSEGRNRVGVFVQHAAAADHAAGFGESVIVEARLE